MSDPTTIEQQIRADNPSFNVRENKRDLTISPATNLARYESMIADLVSSAVRLQEKTATETTERDRRGQVRTALTGLDDSATLLLGADPVTSAQIRSILGQVCRVMALVIRVLIRHGLIERDATG